MGNPTLGLVLAGGGAVQRTYLWPYQMHASIGPSCAVAQWQPEGAASVTQLRVWAGTQNPHVLRADLAKLTGLQDVQVDVVRLEAAGCYGRNGADDVAADAALLARAMASRAFKGPNPRWPSQRSIAPKLMVHSARALGSISPFFK